MKASHCHPDWLRYYMKYIRFKLFEVLSIYGGIELGR